SQGYARRLIVFPIEGRVDDDTSRRSQALLLARTEICVISTKLIGETPFIPALHPVVGPGVRVQQHDVGVESMSLCRVVRAMNPVTVTLPDRNPLDIDVPN